MTVAAWVYDNYYCWGISSNYKGVYSDQEEALEVLRGGRWTHQNLELLDLSTLGFTVWKWEPIYEYNSEYLDEKDEDGTHKKKETLTKRYDKTAVPIELKYGYGGEKLDPDHQILFDAGYWDKQE